MRRIRDHVQELGGEEDYRQREVGPLSREFGTNEPVKARFWRYNEQFPVRTSVNPGLTGDWAHVQEFGGKDEGGEKDGWQHEVGHHRAFLAVIQELVVPTARRV